MMSNETQRHVVILRLFSVKVAELRIVRQLDALNEEVTPKRPSSQEYPSITSQAKSRTKRAMLTRDFEEVRKHVAIYNAVEGVEARW